MSGRLAILTSHPIQYYAPLFREIARHIDVKVFFAHKATAEQQAAAGFGTAFDWDLDLLDGYPYGFLRNVASNPSMKHFWGCDTPEIGEMLAAGRFEALLVTGWYLKSYWQSILAAKRCGLPVMVRGDSHLRTPRGRAKQLMKEAIYPVLLRVFDAALYVGERNRAYYEHYGYPTKQLFHSPHCIDTERFAAGAGADARAALRVQLGIEPDEKAVLFAGKLVDFKRPLDVIEAAALARVRGQPVRVIVAGSGPLEADVTARAKALGVSLHLLGFQNQTQMPAAYAAADVLVLPSGEETWGLVCNEALACGTPIIVSDAVGCAPDLAADGLVGRTFPVGNVTALAEAIAAVLGSPPPAPAIRKVSERYGLSAAIAGIVAALQIISKRAPRVATNVSPSVTAHSGPTFMQRLCRHTGHLPIPKIRGLLWRLCAVGCAAPRHFTVPFAGLTYQGRLDQHIDRHIYFFGGYSPAELDFLGRAARILRNQRDKLTFVDVGANVGQHSLYMACHVDRIFAFEPNNVVADQFEANLRLNELNNVEVLRYALGCEDETAELGTGFYGNSGSRSLTWSLDEARNTKVQVRRADSALAELDIKRIDLLKIDVEGYGRNVLVGLAKRLQRDRPGILFELVGTDVKGGFRSEVELRETLYDDHCLYALVGGRRAGLVEFDWTCEEAVCLPRELVESFASLIK